MDQKSLLQRLAAYSAEDHLPMHMPGHKRCGDFPYLAPFSFRYDITEIDGFDDLNCPDGVFKESEELAAKLWGSDECIYSVNGSTGAILSAVRGVLVGKKKPKLIMARNSHRSLYHACEICFAEPIYLNVKTNEYGFHLAMDPREVEKALAENPDASLVVITSPTYEGVISDVRSIADICHAYGVPLMVDEAHGAHLSLHGVFRDGAVKCGADVVVQSLHKTLPSLTQTAIMHLNGDLIDKREIRRQAAIFQTSSPSYILSSSIDGAVRFLSSDEGKARLLSWRWALEENRRRLSALKNISLYDGGELYDLSKLIVLSDGVALSSHLREKHKIEVEMTSLSYVVAMSGAGDTYESIERFANALEFSDSETFAVKYCFQDDCDDKKTLNLIPSEAVRLESEEIPIEFALGKTSASYVFAYPPGIPLLVPGETIDGATLRKITDHQSGGISIRGINDGKIRVIKE